VAAQVGITQEVYGRMERGRMAPSITTFRRLCVALGVSADTLLGLEASRRPAVTEPLVLPRQSNLRRVMQRASTLPAPALRLLYTLLGQLAPRARRGRKYRPPIQGPRISTGQPE
jgi:transcriptional regulator with XRE-family HTH domain